jgi:hypothetical protein
MKKFWTLWILAVVFLTIAASGACKVKEPPFPNPEPTPVPTIVVVNTAVCFTKAPDGTSYCRDAAGQFTACPADVSALPACVDPNAATCYVKTPAGTPPVCRNAAGAQVPCPAQMGDLTVCGN